MSQSYSRYLQQYDICSQVISEIFRLFPLAAKFLTIFLSILYAASITATVALGQRALPEKFAWKYFRYVNALHVLAYAGLSKKLNLENFFFPMNRTWKLLTPKEEKRVAVIAASSDMGCEKEVIPYLPWYSSLVNHPPFSVCPSGACVGFELYQAIDR